MGAAAAIMIRKEKDLIAHFRGHQATSANSAKSLNELQIGTDHAFGRLRNAAVVREASTGLWYLDEPSWEARQRRRRMMISVVLIVAVLLSLAVATRRFFPA